MKNKKKTFVTIFTRCEDVHLIKDVGIIPYIMCKNHNYDSKIVCYQNSDDYQNLKNTPGLKIEFIKKKFNKYIDTLCYLIKNSKKIDVLNLYHMRPYANMMIRVYKLLNRKGKVYLKMDADYIKFKYTSLAYNKLVAKRTIKLCKLVSCESKELSDMFKKDGLNIQYVPNGCLVYKPYNNEKKEKIILTVGRLGTYQKATEVLLDVFKELKEKYNSKYKLHLIGTMEEDFKDKYDKFLKDNPKLKADIKYFGNIADRSKLDSYYNKSEVFCLPSRFESFGLVVPEAAIHGCYIVTTDFGAASKVLISDDKIGKICKIDDVSMMAKSISEYENRKDNDVDYRINYMHDNFDWESIVKKINEYLEK